eukprot:PhF_6_TR15682/c0_g1_i1/m.24383
MSFFNFDLTTPTFEGFFSASSDEETITVTQANELLDALTGKFVRQIDLLSKRVALLENQLRSYKNSPLEDECELFRAIPNGRHTPTQHSSSGGGGSSSGGSGTVSTKSPYLCFWYCKHTVGVVKDRLVVLRLQSQSQGVKFVDDCASECGGDDPNCVFVIKPSETEPGEFELHPMNSPLQVNKEKVEPTASRVLKTGDYITLSPTCAGVYHSPNIEGVAQGVWVPANLMKSVTHMANFSGLASGAKFVASKANVANLSTTELQKSFFSLMGEPDDEAVEEVIDASRLTQLWAQSTKFNMEGPAAPADRDLWVKASYPGIPYGDVIQSETAIEIYKLGPQRFYNKIVPGWQRRFVVRYEKFLLYFPNRVDCTLSLGCIYLPGCSVDTISGEYRGKRYCIKIRPTVPRDIQRVGKRTQSNNFVISLGTQKAMDELVEYMKRIALADMEQQLSAHLQMTQNGEGGEGEE